MWVPSSLGISVHTMLDSDFVFADSPACALAAAAKAKKAIAILNRLIDRPPPLGVAFFPDANRNFERGQCLRATGLRACRMHSLDADRRNNGSQPSDARTEAPALPLSLGQQSNAV